jgi:hypothetical protein
LWYRERSVSVQLAVYCGAVWYRGTERGRLVCSWLCIVERCGIVVQTADCLVSPSESHGDLAVCTVTECALPPYQQRLVDTVTAVNRRTDRWRQNVRPSRETPQVDASIFRDIGDDWDY